MFSQRVTRLLPKCMKCTLALNLPDSITPVEMASSVPREIEKLHFQKDILDKAKYICLFINYYS